jgi:hypothetical protein
MRRLTMWAALPGECPSLGLSRATCLRARTLFDTHLYPDSLAYPVGPRDIALRLTQPKTPLAKFLLLLHDVTVGSNRIENTRPRVVTVLLPSNRRSFWLHSSCFEQMCRIILVVLKDCT